MQMPPGRPVYAEQSFTILIRPSRRSEADAEVAPLRIEIPRTATLASTRVNLMVVPLNLICLFLSQLYSASESGVCFHASPLWPKLPKRINGGSLSFR